MDVTRFVAVFNRLQASYGVGFDNLVDTVDFLFWGHEDQALLPQGIYDISADQVAPYYHAGGRIGPIHAESIRTVATDCLMDIRQWYYFFCPIT